jgi:hypothetical protein
MKRTINIINKLNRFFGDKDVVTCTATTAGATTGIIPSSATVVNAVGVNGQSAYLILLPTPVVGKKVIIYNDSGYAFNLATSSAANIYLNGAKTAGYKLAFANAKVAYCDCVSSTQWVVVINDYTAAS